MRFGRFACVVGLNIALLAGCGAQTTTPMTAASQNVPSPGTGAVRDPNKLVYLSEWRILGHPSAAIFYGYKSMRRVGHITGFNERTGQCVDAAGDVWIAQADGQAVTEYAHGGTTPIKTLATSGRAFGCSVAPDGDLAVGNFDVGSAPGSIQVFKNASGPPHQYTCPGFGYYDDPGYDANGNLYVEVLVDLRTSTTGVCELPAGGNALRPVSLNVTIGATGSTMWDGKYITLTDTNYNGTYGTAIYQATESPSGNLTVVGTTVLFDRRGRVAGGRQPFIVGDENTPRNRHQGSVVVGFSESLLTYWNYPAGGKPIKRFPDATETRHPFGESVSIDRATSPSTLH